MGIILKQNQLQNIEKLLNNFMHVTFLITIKCMVVINKKIQIFNFFFELLLVRLAFYANTKYYTLTNTNILFTFFFLYPLFVHLNTFQLLREFQLANLESF